MRGKGGLPYSHSDSKAILGILDVPSLWPSLWPREGSVTIISLSQMEH